jgi:hypothetical protein
MTEPSAELRPCRYCIAAWAGYSKSDPPIRPEPRDCEWEHRDDPRVYALATEMARAVAGNRDDEHAGWFLADADQIVDDFDPTPDRWRVRRLPAQKRDGEDEIEIRLRINGVTYVGLEGGKDTRGPVLPLATFRQERKEANASG